MSPVEPPRSTPTGPPRMPTRSPTRPPPAVPASSASRPVLHRESAVGSALHDDRLLDLHLALRVEFLDFVRAPYASASFSNVTAITL